MGSRTHQSDDLHAFSAPLHPLDTENGFGNFAAPTRQIALDMDAARLLFAAARGGKLRRLRVDAQHFMQHPFAIRTLLPAWVAMEMLLGSSRTFELPTEAWQAAAASLRPLLAHASIWLSGSPEDSLHSRLLEDEQVASLNGFFTAERLGPLALPTWRKAAGSQGPLQHPVLLYLPWLKDIELAGQVADAWNAVVHRRQADKVKCPCKDCAEWYLQLVAEKEAEQLRLAHEALEEARIAELAKLESKKAKLQVWETREHLDKWCFKKA